MGFFVALTWLFLTCSEAAIFELRDVAGARLPPSTSDHMSWEQNNIWLSVSLVHDELQKNRIEISNFQIPEKKRFFSMDEMFFIFIIALKLSCMFVKL